MTTDPRIATLQAFIRDIPDFPRPGILFRDLTPLLADAKALRTTIDLLADRTRALEPELVVGIESRGFIFGAALADRLGTGFVPVRKPGKLPYKRLRETYELEYGTDALELHEDAVDKRRVLVVDDLLATGGTAGATGRLVARAGGHVVGYGFIVELGVLGGRKPLAPAAVESLITY